MAPALVNIRYREATAGDGSEVAALVNAAFQVEQFFIRGDRTSPPEVVALLDRGAFLLAEDGARMAACVYVEVRAGRGYFGMLSVSPQSQGAGLGRAMVQEAEGYLRRAGCAAIDIRIVHLRTELPPFYRRFGYLERTTEPWPAEHAGVLKEPAHFIVMTKDLTR